MEAPNITNIPGNIMMNTIQGMPYAIVDWIEPTATDNSGLIPNIKSSHLPPAKFGIGNTNVVYNATDSFGNTAKSIFTVSVIGKSTF